MAEIRPLPRSFALLMISILAIASAAPRPLAAACADPLPVRHRVSHFICGEGLPAYLYQATDPATNSGGEDLVCEAPGGVRCAGGGSAGDALVTIETDWSRAGFSGCPVTLSGP